MGVVSKVLRRRSGNSVDANEMTLMQHLEELRMRLIWSCIALAVAMVIAWPLFGPFVSLVEKPYCTYVGTLPAEVQPPQGCRLIINDVTSPMLVKLKVVLYIAIALALPFLLYQLWAFILPGLHDNERRMAVPFIVSAVILFATGATFAYLLLPKGLEFLLGFAGLGETVAFLTFNHYISFVVLVMLSFGISFEFPIFLIFLLMAHVITTEQLRHSRRFAILGISVFAAVITPSSDIYTMLGLTIPLVLFYEAAIIVGRLMKR